MTGAINRSKFNQFMSMGKGNAQALKKSVVKKAYDSGTVEEYGGQRFAFIRDDSMGEYGMFHIQPDGFGSKVNNGSIPINRIDEEGLREAMAQWFINGGMDLRGNLKQDPPVLTKKGIAKASADLIDGSTVTYPDTIQVQGGTLSFIEFNRYGRALYEGKLGSIYCRVGFEVALANEGGQDPDPAVVALDVFMDYSESDLEDAIDCDEPITGTEGRARFSEIPQYVADALTYMGEYHASTKKSKKGIKKSNLPECDDFDAVENMYGKVITAGGHKFSLDEDPSGMCAYSPDDISEPMIFIYPPMMNEWGEPTDWEWNDEKHTVRGGDPRNNEAQFKEFIDGAVKSVRKSRSRVVKSVPFFLDPDVRTEPEGRKFAVQAKLNGESFYPVYFDTEEQLANAVATLTEYGFKENAKRNYTDEEGIKWVHYWKDEW